eukprot:m.148250 g.148250  ORF g.148250 m.148250 type:complete len:701 (-) comp16278_c0_seq1:249-2351(-)
MASSTASYSNAVGSEDKASPSSQQPPSAMLSVRQDSGVLSAPLSTSGSNSSLTDMSSLATKPRTSSRLATAQSAPVPVSNPTSTTTAPIVNDPWSDLHSASALPGPSLDHQSAAYSTTTITVTDPSPSSEPVQAQAMTAATRKAWIAAGRTRGFDQMAPPSTDVDLARDSGTYSHSASLDEWGGDVRGKHGTDWPRHSDADTPIRMPPIHSGSTPPSENDADDGWPGSETLRKQAKDNAIAQLQQDFSSLAVDSGSSAPSSHPSSYSDRPPLLAHQGKSLSEDYGFGAVPHDTFPSVEAPFSAAPSWPGHGAGGIWSDPPDHATARAFDAMLSLNEDSPASSSSGSPAMGRAGGSSQPQTTRPHQLTTQESVEYGFPSDMTADYGQRYPLRHSASDATAYAPRHPEQRAGPARPGRHQVQSYPSHAASYGGYNQHHHMHPAAVHHPSLPPSPMHGGMRTEGTSSSPLMFTDNFGRQYYLTPVGPEAAYPPQGGPHPTAMHGAAAMHGGHGHPRYASPMMPDAAHYGGGYHHHRGGLHPMLSHSSSFDSHGGSFDSGRGDPRSGTMHPRRKAKQWTELMAEEGITSRDRDLWYFMKQIRLHKYTTLFLGKTLAEMRQVTDEELRVLGLTEGARRKLITELFMIPDHAKTFPRSLNKNRYDKLNEAIRNGNAPYIPPDEPGRVPPSHQRQQAILQGAPEAAS